MKNDKAYKENDHVTEAETHYAFEALHSDLYHRCKLVIDGHTHTHCQCLWESGGPSRVSTKLKSHKHPFQLYGAPSLLNPPVAFLCERKRWIKKSSS